MTILSQLTPKDIANLILVILFWITPTVYGQGTLIYFIAQFKKKTNKNKKLSISEAARVLHPWNTDGGESHTL